MWLMALLPSCLLPFANDAAAQQARLELLTRWHAPASVTRSTERTLIPRVRGSSDGPLVRSVSMLRPVPLHMVHMGERPRQPTRAQAARMSALHALRRSGIA